MEETYLLYLADGVTPISVNKEKFTEVISDAYGGIKSYAYLLPEESYSDMFPGYKTKVIRYNVRYVEDDKLVYRIGTEFHMERIEKGEEE